MSNADRSSVDQIVLKTVMASFVQIIALLLLLYWCFTILSPFLSIILWGLIISVALYPAAEFMREGEKSGSAVRCK